tara:strand:- start:74 stop:505 length:432 start_codon:yes stop_codon:yes gene_type:complete
MLNNEEFKKLRIQYAYSQKDFGYLLKKSQKTISQWEAGKQPRLLELKELAIKLAYNYGVEVACKVTSIDRDEVSRLSGISLPAKEDEIIVITFQSGQKMAMFKNSDALESIIDDFDYIEDIERIAFGKRFVDFGCNRALTSIS